MFDLKLLRDLTAVRLVTGTTEFEEIMAAWFAAYLRSPLTVNLVDDPCAILIRQRGAVR